MGEHGQGGATKLPNGRYRVALTMPDGRRVYRRARTERQARVELRKLVEAREADLNPSSQTLAEWLRSWLRSLRDAKHQRIRPGTLDHYTNVVERHIIPGLGGRKLGALSERHVQAWLDADSAAARTVHHHRAVLRRALNVATRLRIVSRNVALGVELPDVTEFAGSPLTLDEARALLVATGRDRLGPLWRLAIDSGARQAELLGLGWDDFDESAGTIRVHSQLVRVPKRGNQPGGWGRAPTKSARDSEVISLMPETVQALHDHRIAMKIEQTADWTHPGHIFTTSTGKPFHQAEILKAFRAACRKAGIPERRFHDLRGTTAKLLKDAGVSEEARMQRLGHATTKMARHYSGVSMDMDRDASRRLAEALAG